MEGTTRDYIETNAEIAGIPVRLKGKNLREKSVNAYNSQLESRTVASLDFGVSDAGVGLALRF